MSSQRRGKIIEDDVEESSSDDDRNETRDFDYEISSSACSTLGRSQEDGRGSSKTANEARRRGRGVSKHPCLNRNAQMARENRRKKKEYLEKIEGDVQHYLRENKKLTNVVQRQAIELDRLKAEINYMKNVVNNSSTINALLKSMNVMLSGKNDNGDVRGVANEYRNRKTTANANCNGKTRIRRTEKGLKDDDGAIWPRGSKYGDRSATQVDDYVFSTGHMRSKSFEDLDHTYTTSVDDSVQIELDNNDENEELYVKESENFDKIVADKFLNDLGQDSSHFGITENVDELPQFDANLFDSVDNVTVGDLIDCHEENFVNHDAGNLFSSLGNSGICLHVNSGKVSLEFCSICHLNSINSTD